MDIWALFTCLLVNAWYLAWKIVLLVFVKIRLNQLNSMGFFFGIDSETIWTIRLPLKTFDIFFDHSGIGTCNRPVYRNAIDGILLRNQTLCRCILHWRISNSSTHKKCQQTIQRLKMFMCCISIKFAIVCVHKLCFYGLYILVCVCVALLSFVRLFVHAFCMQSAKC